MCLGDWRLGRLMSMVQTRFATFINRNLSYPAAPNRVGIMIVYETYFQVDCGLSETGGPLPNPVSITGSIATNDILAVAIDGVAGLQLDSTNKIFHATLATHGILPTKSFVLSNIANDCTGNVYEWFLPTEVLSAAIAQFQSEYLPWKR